MSNSTLNVLTLYGAPIPLISEFRRVLYLNCVMDLFSRKIIAWTLSDTMEVSSVIETINIAKAVRNTDLPLLIHSDHGSQYASNAWREAKENMQRSYSHKGILMTIPALNPSIP